MRDYLFKGKCKDNKEWIFGFFANNEYGTCYIIKPVMLTYVATFNWIEVIPETVGQYIGTKDKNGNRIFEGDLVKDFVESNIVEWDTRRARFHLAIITTDTSKGIHQTHKDFPLDGSGLIIIGNIHDNPELLQSL